MRIVALADIHGNMLALEAALAEAERLNPDRIVVLGDIVVGSPDSLACWKRIQALNCPILRGNHERYVCDFGTPRAPAEWNTPRFGPVQHAVATLGEENRRQLAALPLMFRLAECPGLLWVHGSSRSDSDLVFPYTSDEELETYFAGATDPWIARGHNHYAGVRLWGERCIVTVGSVGLPLDGTPAAQFSVFELNRGKWSVSHRKVAYDVEAAGRRFVETGYLEKAGPMARLYWREVLTASFHVVPFLEWFKRAASTHPDLTLDQAVARFCPAAG
ncbi:metallophosphoesterase [Opitutaceae bacterium EW11]|nr:metallophosphoesterase [Opitutaceae bacterium EW11]